MRTWLIALYFSLVCALAGSNAIALTKPRNDGFEAERARAVKELISGLQGYVDWCSNKKIWVERNRGLLAILVVDPGNMSAKRGLGWDQVADGVWDPPAVPKPAKNFDPGALKEAPTRYAEAIRPWREKLAALLDEHVSDLTTAQRESVQLEILSIDPNDAQVREARGEVRSDKGWLLKETVHAKERRGQIKAIVAEALAAAPKMEETVPSAADMVFGVDWKVSVGSDRVHVLSTGERPEALRMAKVLHAAQDVFQKVYGTHTTLGAGFTIYLLCDKASKATFIANVPDISEATRSFYAQVDGAGFTTDSGSGAWWPPTADRRLDGVLRHAFGTLIRSEFNITVDQAWAWESQGMYLTREMIGTRLTWYIVPVEEQQESASSLKGSGEWIKKLLTPGMNWMNEGYRILRSGDSRTLMTTLTRPVNTMTPQDLFVSYVVGAYLLESQDLRLPELLRALGGPGGRAPLKAPEAWTAALNMDLNTFQVRLVRWLGERR